MRNCIVTFIQAGSLALAMPAFAATPLEMQRDYEAQARKDDASFKASAARGESFFRKEHATAKAGTTTATACAACHTQDPRQSGRTRANKTIEPLAPVANPARFTDPAKVEKWLVRNCGDVLGRACSAAEKADFIAWLINLKI